MQKGILAGILLIGLSASSALLAHEKKKHAHYEEPYGMAGCGMWTYAISDKSQGAQLGVWALNTLIFDGSQTSAISTGTSNCVAARPKMAAVEQKVFISANLVPPSAEAAQGTGETLHALAEIFGCSDKAGFNKLSQKHYEKIFKVNEPEAVLQNYHNVIKSDAKIASQCSRIS